MKQSQLNLARNIKNVLLIYTFIGVINGYPVSKKDIDNPGLTDEKTYPNGTVVGKYLYKDSDGNPIHVKYYADESGYGVELQSLKVVSTHTSQPIDSSEQTQSTKYAIKTNDDIESKTTLSPIYDHKTTSNPFEDLDKNYKSSKNKYKSSPDYEIFVDSELKAPKKCGQDKVHVYFENNKRKARNSLNEFDAMKYCEQLQFP